MTSPAQVVLKRYGWWGYGLLAVIVLAVFTGWLALSNWMRGGGFATVAAVFVVAWLMRRPGPLNQSEQYAFRVLFLVALFFFPGVFFAGVLRLVLVAGIASFWFLFHPIGGKQ